MKREFLEGLDLGEGVKLSKAAIDAIMAENGKDIEAKNNTITTLTTERDGLKTQLETANTTIKSYKDMDVEGIKAKADEWETKYNTDTQALKDQLDAANYGFAINGAVAGLKFSSESAKKAFVADLTAKKLPLQEGKLLGMDDFVKSYQNSDPNAFLPEGDDKTPVATKGGTGGGTQIAADAALRAAFGLPDNSKKE
ncbi:MAG: phage scaffolding protein [Oscillospiraceae bacterium]|nr:phage scaffolding protein [Oscillospiraceae bacterium]